MRPYKYGERIRRYSRKKSYFLCPECEEKLARMCLCPIQDAVCKNGHHWHLRYEDGKAFVVQGEGAH